MKKELGFVEFECRQKQCVECYGESEKHKKKVVKEALATNAAFATLMEDLDKRRGHKEMSGGTGDVSCASYSRCTLNSSSVLVARATISKIQSRSLSSSDFLVCTRPEMHRRCPAFELFLMRPRSKNNFRHEPQNPTMH